MYGVQNIIEFKIGDYFNHDIRLKADVVYISPPWGDPEYTNQPIHSMVDMCAENGGGKRFIEIAFKIVIYLARNLGKSGVLTPYLCNIVKIPTI